MKRWGYAVLAGGLLFGTLGAPSLRAQDEDEGTAVEAQAAKGEGHEFGAKMKEKLGLSDEQAAKVKDAFKAAKDAGQPLREQMKADMKTLEEQVKNKAADAEIQATLDKLSSDRKAGEAARENLKTTLQSVLSPTQQAKMVLSMRGHMGGGKGDGKGSWKGHGKKGKGDKKDKDDDGDEK